MKKYLSRILCLLMALTLVFCFTACLSSGKDDDDGDKNEVSIFGQKDNDPIVGTYQFLKMTYGDQTITRATIEASANGRNVDDYFYLKINANGTGVLCSGDEPSEMEYDDTHIWPVEAPDEKAEYTFKNGKFTISADGYVFEFKK